VMISVEGVKHGPRPCDGCGEVVQTGELALVEIESCCGGGCYRILCRTCVRLAAKLMDAAEKVT